jgi:hypothetical protein
MVSSTVARRVDVPARGSNENATFPKGQLVKGKEGGDGTTRAAVDADLATDGNDGKVRQEAATGTCRIKLRRFHKSLVFASKDLVASYSFGSCLRQV